VRGEAGSFRKFGLDPQEAALREGGKPDGPEWGRESKEHWGELTEGGSTTKVETVAGNYPAFYENLRDVLLGKAQLAVPAIQALRVTRLLELARESSRRGVWLPANAV
jgi:scyllo-inositol 2-dehydrogenase (NADP+)